MSPVDFESELFLHGVERGLDPVADATQIADPGFFAFPVGADQFGLQLVRVNCAHVMVGAP